MKNLKTTGRWRNFVLAGTAIAALALSACSSGAGSTGSSNGESVLRMAERSDVQSFDPQMAAVAQTFYLDPIFDTLIHAKADNSFEAGLATEWESIDPTTFEFTIRPGVSFSDGVEMNTEAVVANFERGMSMTASPSASFYNNIDVVEAVDESTVRLSLANPTTDMLVQLSGLPGMMMSPESFDADPDILPIGAGGWVHDASTSNSGEMQAYEANPSYWDPESVKVDRVEIRVYEDSSAASNAMFDGQVDVITLQNEADRASFEKTSLQLIERAIPNVYYIQIMDTDGTLLEPMSDERVRRALSLGTDRDAFNQGLQFGNGNPTPSFWLENTPYYDSALEDLAYNPEEARRLLAEAGYPDGFTVKFPTFGTLATAAESVQQMWAEIGVTVQLETVEPGTLAKVMRSGDTAMTVTMMGGLTAEAHYMERHAPGGPYDPLLSDRGEVAELANKALTAETQEGQEDGWRDVYTYLIEQGYLIVVGHQSPTVIVAEHLSGVEVSPSDFLPKPYGISVS